MKSSPVLVIAMTLINPLAIAQTRDSSSDKEAIRSIAMNFQDAWNRHDIKSLSVLVAEDVDFINVGGVWLKSRKEFEEHHARAHQAHFKQSVLTTNDVHIKFISPKIAVVHVEWAMQGDQDPDGTPRQPRRGVFTWVVEKQNRKWWIIAAHNTNVREPPGR